MIQEFLKDIDSWLGGYGLQMYVRKILEKCRKIMRLRFLTVYNRYMPFFLWSSWEVDGGFVGQTTQLLSQKKQEVHFPVHVR